MAIIARVRVPGASAEDHDRLQQEVESRLVALGGPPEGLMVHLAYAEGDDLLIVEAWRTAELFDSYSSDVLQGALEAAGLRPTAAEVGPALSIARP